MALGTTIPSQLIKKLIPVLMKQVDTLATEAEKFVNQVSQIPLTTDCNDPRMREAKATLQKIYDLINVITTGLNSINQITPVISTIASVSSILSTIQLAIPAVPGVPTGPIAKLITTFDNIGKNSKSAVSSLQGMVSAVNITFSRINQLLAKVIARLSSICNSETFNVSADVSDALNDLDTDNAANIPTKFYTELNVSDNDITQRLSIIEELASLQLNILSNLKEAPSRIISGTVVPTITTGDINDYYIDIDTSTIYGPKTDIGWGSGVKI
jgi:ABC-type transporter Mla subunit MlaD